MSALEWELDSVDWLSLRAGLGYADRVPTALRALSVATSEEEAKFAYWQLDNHVVVQGTLHEAAPHVVRSLLYILCGGSVVAKRHALDLLVELVSGKDPPSELGDVLWRACVERAREGLAVIQWLLGSEDSPTRRWAVLVLEHIEPDRGRLLSTMRQVLATDSDERVRQDASHVLRRNAPG